jgi:two-component system phosphate regulon response regulator PhoB
MLPDVPGISVCKRLKEDRRTEKIPVIIVSARGEEIDRIVGFEVGADDYVVKPFSVRELLLRMEAVMRRPQASPPSRLLTLGSLRLDQDAHRVWVDSDEVVLKALEFRRLATLCERPDHVYSREALLSSVWGIRADPDSRAVDTVVKRLREKLGTAGRHVVAVRGAGYRFSAEPER